MKQAIYRRLPSHRKGEGVSRHTFDSAVQRVIDQWQLDTRVYDEEGEPIMEGDLFSEDEAVAYLSEYVSSLRAFPVYEIVDEVDLPYHFLGVSDHGWCFDPNCHDRYFRNAMRWDDTAPNKCRCDMPTAREIHMGRIRKRRDVELANLDVPYLKALETGDTVEQTRIATLKQVLRNIPQTFGLEAATTPEGLKGLWPAELPRP